MDYFIMAAQLILSLSILVTLHEFGHFITAKWFGMRVSKFYLFFDFMFPFPNLANFSLIKVKRGETEYGLGWFPLGGYVTIEGMVDENMNVEALSKPAEPWEFRAKPAWQRLIVMLGGIIVNFALGIFIWSLLLWGYGKEYFPAKSAVHGIVADEMAKEMGLQDGDKILSIGGQPFEKLEGRAILRGLLFSNAKTIEVERNGSPFTINLPEGTLGKLASYKGSLIAARIPFVVKDVIKGQPAESAGFQVGDSLISLNGAAIPYFHEFSKTLRTMKDTNVTVGLVRAGESKTITLKTTAGGTIGLAPKTPATATETFSFGAAFPQGVSESWNFLAAQVAAFGKMFSGEIKASESLGGFGSIAKMFPTEWDWRQFWHITAVLSLILGFMNLLPIPALDGGHAVFLIVEMIIRRPLPQKFQEVAQVIGMLMLFGLLIFANGMDIYKAIVGK